MEIAAAAVSAVSAIAAIAAAILCRMIIAVIIAGRIRTACVCCIRSVLICGTGCIFTSSVYNVEFFKSSLVILYNPDPSVPSF